MNSYLAINLYIYTWSDSDISLYWHIKHSARNPWVPHLSETLFPLKVVLTVLHLDSSYSGINNGQGIFLFLAFKYRHNRRNLC